MFWQYVAQNEHVADNFGVTYALIQFTVIIPSFIKLYDPDNAFVKKNSYQ